MINDKKNVKSKDTLAGTVIAQGFNRKQIIFQIWNWGYQFIGKEICKYCDGRGFIMFKRKFETRIIIKVIGALMKNALLYWTFYTYLHLFLWEGSINLSKKTFSISLLIKKLMNYLLGMKKKQLKLNIGLERILSFLLSVHNAPAQYSKQKE